jgi:hypothetical protein
LGISTILSFVQFSLGRVKSAIEDVNVRVFLTFHLAMSKTESSAPPFYFLAHGGLALVDAPAGASGLLGCGGRLAVLDFQPFTSF